MGAAIALSAVGAACGGDSSSDRDELIDEIAATVEMERERTGAPGIDVAIEFADGEVWTEQFGVSDLDAETALAPGLTWPLRSVTKSFTVNALLQLADDEVLALTDTVDTYVDGVERGDEITLFLLADMSSGLPEYANAAFVEDFVADVTRDFSDAELLSYIDGEPLLFEPGAEHVYINTNTLLLGMVIEAATGQSLDTYLQEEILDPLGLASTVYAPNAADIAESVPTGYQPDDDGPSAAPLTFGVFGGAGAMAATIDDLLAWGPALALGEGVEDGGDAQRADARPLDEGPEYDSYGLGIGELEGWWGHTGEGLGYTALVMYDPDSDTTVAITANISNLDEHVPTSLFRALVPLLDEQ